MQKTDQTIELVPIRGCNLTQAGFRSLMQGDSTRVARFEYCLSFVLFTIRYRSPVYVSTNDWQEIVYGTFYSLVSMFFGLWALPWGPILTAKTIWRNMNGGIDASEEVREWLATLPVFQIQSESGQNEKVKSSE